MSISDLFIIEWLYNLAEKSKLAVNFILLRMKKSNYLHLLKEVDNKKGLIASKTFKQSKKNTNCHNSRNSNPKTTEHGLLGRIDAYEG